MEIEDIRVKTVTHKKKNKFLWIHYNTTSYVENIIEVKYKGGEWQLLKNERVIEFI